MGKKHRVVSIAVYLLVMSIGFQLCSIGAFASDIPDRLIRVGLKYGLVTANEEMLTSTSGFELMSQSGSTQTEIYDLSNYETIKAVKDDSYHIQIGETYSDLNSMLTALEKIKKKEEEAYPAFESGWKVMYGSYSTSGKAQDEASSLASKLGTAMTVTATNSSFVRVSGDGDIVFLYDAAGNDFYFKPAGSAVAVYYGDKGYRGGIGFKRYSNSVLTVINYIELDDYLYGVLPKEMAGDWPLEALKAQAVAARNFTVANLGKHESYGFDICTTTDCQVYGGYDVEKPRSNQAVDETSGKLLKYNGQIVQAFYHSNSGGRTENIENVWSATLPYIVGVDDPYSVGAPNSDWTLSYTTDELETILENNGYNIGRLKGVRIDDISKNGRVQKFTFVGSSGDAEFIKEKLRALLGYTTLKSMYFELGNKPMVSVVSRSSYERLDLSSSSFMTEEGVTKSSGNDTFIVTDGSEKATLTFESEGIVFQGHGYGHGLGMSQWGAKAMAEDGKSYEEILLHYYKNTEIE